jgi:hypothetical protein
MTYWSGIIHSCAHVNKKNAKGWATRGFMKLFPNRLTGQRILHVLAYAGIQLLAVFPNER